jgi:putative salt-induced outer membrane protein YdiY
MKLWTLPLIVAIACVPANADHIGLKNGDRLTGKVVRSDGKTLLIRTELAGDVTVSLSDVVELKADAPLFLSLADGRTVSGTVATAGGAFEVRTLEGAAIAVNTADLRAIRSADEQAEADRLTHPGLFDLWQGGANFGLGFTQGNSETTTVTSGVALSRRTTRDKITLYLASLYARDGNAEPEPRTTANAIRGGGRYDYDINSRLFAYGFVDLEHNAPQDLTLRLVPGGGLGYHAIRSERMQFDLFGGAAWNREWFATSPDRSSAEAQLGQSLSYQLGARTSIVEQLVAFPNLSDPGEYRLNFDVGVTTAITKRIGWQVTVSDRYLSNPSPGFERNDLIVTTGLTFKIGRTAN